MAGSKVKEDFSFDQSAEDPKDLIGFHNEYRKVGPLVEQNKLAEVRALGERLIKQRPQFYELYDLVLGAALKQKDYGSAVRYGEKAIALKPGRVAHFLLGVAYSKNKQNEAAARQFELALEFIRKDKTTSLANRVRACAINSGCCIKHSSKHRSILSRAPPFLPEDLIVGCVERLTLLPAPFSSSCCKSSHEPTTASNSARLGVNAVAPE